MCSGKVLHEATSVHTAAVYTVFAAYILWVRAGVAEARPQACLCPPDDVFSQCYHLEGLWRLVGIVCGPENPITTARIYIGFALEL